MSCTYVHLHCNITSNVSNVIHCNNVNQVQRRHWSSNFNFNFNTRLKIKIDFTTVTNRTNLSIKNCVQICMQNVCLQLLLSNLLLQQCQARAASHGRVRVMHGHRHIKLANCWNLCYDLRSVPSTNCIQNLNAIDVAQGLALLYRRIQSERAQPRSWQNETSVDPKPSIQAETAWNFAEIIVRRISKRGQWFSKDAKFNREY